MYVQQQVETAKWHAADVDAAVVTVQTTPWRRRRAGEHWRSPRGGDSAVERRSVARSRAVVPRLSRERPVVFAQSLRTRSLRHLGSAGDVVWNGRARWTPLRRHQNTRRTKLLEHTATIFSLAGSFRHLDLAVGGPGLRCHRPGYEQVC